MPFLHIFLRITQEPLNIFKISLSHVTESLRQIRITIGFILKISFIMYKTNFLGQNDRFSPYFFSIISGQGRAYYGSIMQFMLEHKFSGKK